MKRFFLTLLLVAVLSLLPIGGIFAAEDTVMVTATGEYVAFDITPTDPEALGTVIADSTTWAYGSTPVTWPLTAAECTFTVNNDSTVPTDTTIYSGNWTGGDAWTNGAGTNGSNIYALWAGAEGTTDEATFLTQAVGTTGTLTLKAGQAALTDFDWEFAFQAPDVMSDGVEKTGTITLTMVTAA